MPEVQAAPAPGSTAPPPGLAEIGVMIGEYEGSDASRAMAERRHALNTRQLARALAATGPVVVGGWRYIGLAAPGLPGVVLRSPAGSPPDEVRVPIVAAHACTAIEDEVMEGDSD